MLTKLGKLGLKKKRSYYEDRVKSSDITLTRHRTALVLNFGLSNRIMMSKFYIYFALNYPMSHLLALNQCSI